MPSPHHKILLGTSAFTASGWEGTFYPSGMKPAEFLTFYSTRFKTVEVDSPYYRTPSASTVKGWAAKTPDDFIFSLKVPASSLPTGREVSSLPTGCVLLQPCGDLKTSRPRGTSNETITHEKVLVDCEKDFENFVEVLSGLGKKLSELPIFSLGKNGDSGLKSLE